MSAPLGRGSYLQSSLRHPLFVRRDRALPTHAQLEHFEQTNWLHKLQDWSVPWWMSIVLYAAIAAGWAMCLYAMLLYGSTFTDVQVRRFMPSIDPTTYQARSRSRALQLTHWAARGVGGCMTTLTGGSVADVVRHLCCLVRPRAPARQGVHGQCLRHCGYHHRGSHRGGRHGPYRSGRHELIYLHGN